MVDEKSQVVPGVTATEFSNWHSSVAACFDELPPAIHLVNVPYEGVTIAALLIETDRTPYVVKNQDGGSIAREVPYRRGTGTESATRAQLIRLLCPLLQLQRQASLTAVCERLSGVAQKMSVGRYSGDLRDTLCCCKNLNQQTVLIDDFTFATCEIDGECPNLSKFTLKLRDPGQPVLTTS